MNNDLPSRSRRNFLKTAGAALAFTGLQRYSRAADKLIGARGAATTSSAAVEGFGPLLDDPAGLIRLPKGFTYQSFSKTGELMDDGFHVPGAHDGMAAFEGPDGSTLLVRNHEMSPGNDDASPFQSSDELFERARPHMYDTAHGRHACTGGTTTLVYDTRNKKLLQHSFSLAGTMRNCSGGPTPWGTWITCEETVVRSGDILEKDHGYCFEVPATAEMRLAPSTPIKGMGRFNHEAVAVDPATSIVYLTEDRPDGLLYRYVPKTPGKMLDGGKLQALAIKDAPSRDTRNWREIGQPDFPIDTPIAAEWIDLQNIEAPEDDLRYRGFQRGAARFARGEGMVYSDGHIYFACTNGGARKFGQIFKYSPSNYEATNQESSQPGTLSLHIESHDSKLMQACDNLTVAPWGDVIICEDDSEKSAIVGVTPEGKLYHIAHIAMQSELAGACFSPDGTTLFVNVQKNPGQTLAITGPWESRRISS
ncbi:alkaline phosphatase PhoX [Pelagicoccus sp. SDUM812003]|uniref:alkaline phosphatase PhoX n=1 Tax=Pelagicoccus sp. SDUM812003 TaxID=3041267 RepID=UPI00280D4B04|nr:alkaline phosphatase PhoX [Pelagicoccus sp. SDUM812003]MDQ8203167.1 DUF839 domain-containing protein [Pelagicoccus sp. SDUM812003]